MAAFAQRMVDLIVLVTSAVLPRKRRWSRRTSTTLFGAGIMMAGLGSFPFTAIHPTAWLARHRREAAGLLLLAAQFELTEEESSVRGAVAALGATLFVLGMATHRRGWCEARSRGNA